MIDEIHTPAPIDSSQRVPSTAKPPQTPQPDTLVSQSEKTKEEIIIEIIVEWIEKILIWIKENLLCWFYDEGNDRIDQLNKQRKTVESSFFSYQVKIDSVRNNKKEMDRRNSIMTKSLAEMDTELYKELEEEVIKIIKEFKPHWTEKRVLKRCEKYMKREPFMMLENKERPIEDRVVVVLGQALINLGDTRFRKYNRV